MKTSTSNIIIAAGALAQLTSAQPHLNRRDEITVTDIAYTTAVVYVTAGGVAPSASTSTAGTAEVKAAHSRLHHQHHKSSSSTLATSTSTAAASSSPAGTTLATYSAPAYSAPASPFTTLSIPADTSTSVAAAVSSSVDSSSAAQASSSIDSSSTAATESSSTYSSSAAATTPSAYGSSSSAAGPSGYGSSSTASAGLSGYGSSTSSAAAPSGTSSGGATGYSGVKAGLSGYIGCESQAGFQALAPYIGWYSDYAANTTGATTDATPNVNGGKIQGIPMLWGDGISCSSVSASRLQGFEDAVASASEMPVMFGMYEPDCECTMSSNIDDVGQGVSDWNKYLAPLKEKFGTTLGSPSMCKQKDETWLSEFAADSSKPTWDVTSIHINVNNIDHLKADVDYYVRTFGKPVWVSEFACVQDVPWTPCEDQDQINTFIEEAVAFFQANESVVAYGPSNGEGLGSTWPLFVEGTHELSPTGQKYLDVIKALQY